MAAQLHLAAVLPSLTHAPDAHYHHLVDDIIEGGKMIIEDGEMRVPTGPGLGVALDPKRLNQYHELGRKWQVSAETSMVGDSRAQAHLAVLPKW
jgi:glucarate dehydratase